MENYEITVTAIRRWCSRGRTDAPWDDLYNEEEKERRLSVWAEDEAQAIDLAQAYDYGENTELLSVDAVEYKETDPDIEEAEVEEL